MSKNIIIDHRMRKIEKETLKNLGYNLIEIPMSTNVYEEISSHVDIFCCRINNKIIAESSFYETILSKFNLENLVCGNSNVR